MLIVHTKKPVTQMDRAERVEHLAWFDQRFYTQQAVDAPSFDANRVVNVICDVRKHDGIHEYDLWKEEASIPGWMHTGAYETCALCQKEVYPDAICERCGKGTSLRCPKCGAFTCTHYSLWGDDDPRGPDGEQLVHRCNWCEAELEEGEVMR